MLSSELDMALDAGFHLTTQDHDMSQNQEWDTQLTEPPRWPKKMKILRLQSGTLTRRRVVYGKLLFPCSYCCCGSVTKHLHKGLGAAICKHRQVKTQSIILKLQHCFTYIDSERQNSLKQELPWLHTPARTTVKQKEPHDCSVSCGVYLLLTGWF